MRMKALLARLSARSVVVLGWALFLVYAVPGQMTQDSLDQLAEARADEWTDAHPPIMTFVWWLVDSIVAGPLGMLLLQSALFLGGLFLLFSRVMPAKRAAWCSVGVLLFPPIMAPMAVIWKDCMMAGLCMMGTALLVRPERRIQIAGVVLLGLGAAFRYNGIALTLPLVVLLFEWRPGLRPLARYSRAALVWLAITGAGFGINMLLADRHTHLWHSSIAIMDIAGTLCYEQTPFSDEQLRDRLAGTGLRFEHDLETTMCKQVGSGTFSRLIAEPSGTWALSVIEAAPPEQRAAIERAWLGTITDYPVAYLEYRGLVFIRLLGIYHDPWGMVTAREPRIQTSTKQSDALGLSTDYSSVQAGWTTALDWLARHTPLFQPWLYLALAILVLIRYRNRHVIAIVLSGITMELGLFVITGSADYRYSHWLVVCACVAAIRGRFSLA